MPLTFTNFHNEAIISINEFTLKLLVSLPSYEITEQSPSIYTLQKLLRNFCIVLNIKTLSEIVLSKELQITLIFTLQFNQNVFISF